MDKTNNVIEVTDNNGYTDIISKDRLDDILLIANKPIVDLINDNLLLFPPQLQKTEDRIESNIICELRTDKDGIKLGTNNIMGVIGVNNTQLRIKSRFDLNRGDYFLHYMLQKVFSVNLFDLKVTAADDQVFDFRWYLFPYLLKKAIRQGLFKTYRTYKHNDSNLKGRIDVSRYFSRNIPFQGKIAYTTREKSVDNILMQLIRHAIEMAKRHPIGSQSLIVDVEMIDCVNQVQLVTPSYNQQERRKIIADNSRTFAHPYYTEYTPLRKLCLQLLRYERMNYAAEEDQTYGILFDGAWLWEEYLNTIFKKLKFTHPQNKSNKDACYLFTPQKYRRYPDFYNEELVVDAKYKKIDESGINRDDLHQIVTYMHMLKLDQGEFIYPTIHCTTARKKVGELNGLGGIVSTIGVDIPQKAASFVDFKNQMKNVEFEIDEIYTNKL